MKNMHKKIVVFDLDGTLLDTLEDIRRALNYALSAYDFPLISKEKARIYVGNGLRNALTKAVLESKKRIDEDDFLLMYQLLLSSYKKHPAEKTVAYSGILDLLRELENKGIKVGIASNKNGEIVRSIVKEKLPFSFSFVLGQGDGYPLKPNTEGIMAKLKEEDISLAEAIYVGDSEVDKQTAENLGSSYFIVNYGFRTKEELEEKGITNTLGSVKELKKAIFDII